MGFVLPSLGVERIDEGIGRCEIHSVRGQVLARADGNRARRPEHVGTRSSAIGQPDPLLTNPLAPCSDNRAVVIGIGRRWMFRGRGHHPDRSEDHRSLGSDYRMAETALLNEKSSRTPILVGPLAEPEAVRGVTMRRCHWATLGGGSRCVCLVGEIGMCRPRARGDGLIRNIQLPPSAHSHLEAVAGIHPG